MIRRTGMCDGRPGYAARFVRRMPTFEEGMSRVVVHPIMVLKFDPH